MELQFLGTGAGQPAKQRNVSSLALKLLDEINEVWMFDCGEGTQRQILETTIKPRKIRKIFITHLHGDHIFGLPGFLSSRSFQASEEQTDLDIYGPIGIKTYVLTSLKVSGARVPYQIHFHEFDDKSLGKIMETDKFVVYAERLAHTIFCMGYRVVQKDLEGTLDAEALKAAGVPFGPLFGKIKNGQDVELEDGRLICAKDYISAPKKAKSSPLSAIRAKRLPVLNSLKMQMFWFMNPPMVRVTSGLREITGILPTCRQHKSLMKQAQNASCSIMYQLAS